MTHPMRIFSEARGKYTYLTYFDENCHTSALPITSFVWNIVHVDSNDKFDRAATCCVSYMYVPVTLIFNMTEQYLNNGRGTEIYMCLQCVKHDLEFDGKHMSRLSFADMCNKIIIYHVAHVSKYCLGNNINNIFIAYNLCYKYIWEITLLTWSHYVYTVLIYPTVRQ